MSDQGGSTATNEPTSQRAPTDPADHDKDPAEQETLARDLGEELTDIFTRFIRGEVDFADVTFLTYETLQDLHVIASGAYELEYEDEEGDESAGYDDREHRHEQEELAMEPDRP